MIEIGYKLLNESARPPEIAFDGTDHTMGIDVFTDQDYVLRSPINDLTYGSCRYQVEQGISKVRDGRCKCHPHYSLLPYANITTGIALDLPSRTHVSWGGRSGLSFNHGRMAFEGKIDSNYRNELAVKIWSLNPQDDQFLIPAGTKIAQLYVIQYTDEYSLHARTELSSTDRKAGFGSTG